MPAPTDDSATPPPAPLDGVRVLDITSGIAGPFCTKLLASYGADVIKLERPGEGDSSRRMGPFPGGIGHPERSGMFLYLNAGKRSVALDVTEPAAQATLDALIRRADLVVTSLRPATLERAGLTADRMRRVNPRASLVAITSFGLDGPYRGFAATDTVLYGLGGAMWNTGHLGRAPLRLAPHVVEFQGGAVAAFACSLALRKLARRDAGEVVDLSLMETQASNQDRQNSLIMAAQFVGESLGRMDASITAARVWPCKDGYIDVGHTAAPFERVLTAIGHPELIGEARYATADARQTLETQTEFIGLFLEWLMNHTKLEAWQILQEHEIASGPVYTAVDILADPHFRARGFWRERATDAGTVTVPGPPFAIEQPASAFQAESEPRPEASGSPWGTDARGSRLGVASPVRAPRLGEHTAEVLAELVADSPPARPPDPPPAKVRATTSTRPSSAAGRLPLDGIRILELTNAMAGPWCTAQLGDWGAEVIRVESIAHWQPGARGFYARPSRELVQASRHWNSCYPDWEPGDRPWERTAIFANSGRSKLALALDINRGPGRDAFLRLIERSDVFVENNAPDVPERLGLTFDQLRAINPRLVMVQMPAYGSSGPHRTFRSYGAQVESVTGHSAVRGYAGGEPTDLEPTFTSDAGAGIMAAFATVLALAQRDRTGVATRVEIALSESFLTWMAEPLLLWQMEGREMLPSGNRDRSHAPAGAYGCRGADSWLTLCVKSDEQWRALAALTGDATLASPELAAVSQRHLRHDEIDERLEAWTRDQDARELMHRLQVLGIAAGVVNPSAEVLDDPHLAARRFFQELTHAETGRRRYPGPPFRFGSVPNPLLRPAPLLGEHNAHILRDLAGLTETEYAELERLGLIGTEFLPHIP